MSPWEERTARAYRALGEQHHVGVLRPEVRRLLGSLAGSRALDFGCGPGRLTLTLAELGAEHVLAVDESPEMVAEARRVVAAAAPGVVERVTVRQADEDMLPTPEPIDCILCSLALMMCDSRQRLERTTAGLVGSLSPNGRLLIVLTHPCFRHQGFPTFHYRLPEDYSYWQAGAPYEVVLAPGPGVPRTVIVDFHWKLEDYASAIGRAGGVISALRELPARWGSAGAADGPPAYLALLVQPVGRPSVSPRPPAGQAG